MSNDLFQHHLVKALRISAVMKSRPLVTYLVRRCGVTTWGEEYAEATGKPILSSTDYSTMVRSYFELTDAGTLPFDLQRQPAELRQAYVVTSRRMVRRVCTELSWDPKPHHEVKEALAQGFGAAFIEAMAEESAARDGHVR